MLFADNLMKTLIALFILSCSIDAFPGVKASDDLPDKRIQLGQLEAMFSDISEKTDWDISGDMLWGYYFTHHEPSGLERAKDALAAKGYRFVGIYLSEKEEPSEPDLFWLHVEKVETHTPESLHQRNHEFYRFASELGLDSYDGMDVGPAGK
ncbi:ribonuclease E inhibitor RraB [Photobacterium sp. 53610]|uniref:ribonuclease E inhibitor RraB n=1 Tax=Photobacterium sp. 53610 TaxID=3102789 RepID=UPI002ED91513